MNVLVNSDVIWDFEQLYDIQSVKELDIGEISQPEKYPQDIIPILRSMKYSSWFTKLKLENCELSNYYDVFMDIASLFQVDSTIEELTIRNSSLTKTTAESILSQILVNDFCSLKYIDFSENELEVYFSLYHD